MYIEWQFLSKVRRIKKIYQIKSIHTTELCEDNNGGFNKLINHFLNILYLYRQMSCWEKEEERIKIIVMMYNLL